MDSFDKMREQDMQILDQHLQALIEHFDSVQIFVNRHEPMTLEGTMRASKGQGNWYARYGQIQEWMVMQEERARVTVHQEDEEEE